MDKDFGRYMEDLEAADMAGARHAQLLEQHEIWRQTTWTGWLVRQLQATARHFKPFMMKVSAMMNNDDTVGKRIFVFLVQLLIVSTLIAFVFTMGRVINLLIGGNVIVKEEEVVIVHEFDTAEEAAKARAAASRGKRSKSAQKEE